MEEEEVAVARAVGSVGSAEAEAEVVVARGVGSAEGVGAGGAEEEAKVVDSAVVGSLSRAVDVQTGLLCLASRRAASQRHPSKVVAAQDQTRRMLRTTESP